MNMQILIFRGYIHGLCNIDIVLCLIFMYLFLYSTSYFMLHFIPVCGYTSAKNIPETATSVVTLYLVKFLREMGQIGQNVG